MVSYIAHIPHSPALLPAISKHRSPLFGKLRNAIKHLATDMYLRKVDTILFITPSAVGDTNSHVIHFAPRYTARFMHLGEFDLAKEIEGDAVMAHLIRSKTGTEHPVKIISDEHIDHATATAALLLLKSFRFKTIPLSYALTDINALSHFGAILRNALESQSRHVAIVSLGDLSRGIGTGETARAHDEALLESLHSLSADTLAALEHEHAAQKVAALRPLAILSGVLLGMQYTRDVLCYEQKQNVGMAVVRFCF